MTVSAGMQVQVLVSIDPAGNDPYFLNVKLFNDYRLMAKAAPSDGRVVTIGNFDGVHLGHRKVIDRCRGISVSESLDFAVCTFEPHPAELFLREPKLRLVTPARKIQLLAMCNVDTVLAQNFDTEFAGIYPEDFARLVLRDALKAKIVVVGEDFRFGKGRKGNVELLAGIGEDLGFRVLGESLFGDSRDTVSSSRIRELLLNGDVTEAAGLLGRHHEVPGEVVKGHQKGTALGFPTINLVSEEVLIPADGIYAAVCVMEDGRRVKGALYVGERPTLGHGRSIEAHLLDFNDNVYGSRVTVRFLQRIREDIKFDNTDDLIGQIEKDVAQVRQILENHD